MNFPAVTLDNHHTLILAILVLFLGRWVNRRIRWLREYGIPEPVTGGLIASIALTLLIVTAGIDVKFDLAARDALLIVFFTTIGLSANLRLLAMGGVMLVVLTAVAVANLIVQNGVGVALAALLGYPAATDCWPARPRCRAATAPCSPGRRSWPRSSASRAPRRWARRRRRSGLIAGGLLGGPLGHG